MGKSKPKYSEKFIKEHICEQHAICVRPGMFVSYYECAVCGKHMRS